MLVENVMTAPVISIGPSASVGAAAGLMLAHRISGLPVVDEDGRLVGMLTEGDFLRRGELGTERKRPRWLEFLTSSGKMADEYVRAHGRKVEEVMTSRVVTTRKDAPLQEAVEEMTRRQIKRLPVLESGRLVGIVSRSDLLQALLRALPADTEAPGSDQQIKAAIEAELSKLGWGASGVIRVLVRDGTVELNGTILDERERLAARVAAENVPGVKSIVDQLVWIEPMSGFVIPPPEIAAPSPVAVGTGR